MGQEGRHRSAGELSLELLLVPGGDKSRQDGDTDRLRENSDFWEWWP